MLDLIEKLTADAKGRVRLMVGRCILRAINDSGSVQVVQAQLLADEVQDDVERIQQYGYTSVPLSGAEGVVVFVGGNRDHGIVIATEDRRYRLKGLAGGEVAIYDDQGQAVHLTRSGIVVKGAGKPVTITDTPKVRMECDLDVVGEVRDRCDAAGKSMAQMRASHIAHTHKTNAVGAQTDTPLQGI